MWKQIQSDISFVSDHINWLWNTCCYLNWQLRNSPTIATNKFEFFFSSWVLILFTSSFQLNLWHLIVLQLFRDKSIFFASYGRSKGTCDSWRQMCFQVKTFHTNGSAVGQVFFSSDVIERNKGEPDIYSCNTYSFFFYLRAIFILVINKSAQETKSS